MKVIGCSLRCSCGGAVETLIDEVFYILTSDHQIIFKGLCSNCGEPTQVKRDILSLIFLCPMSEEKGN